mmetsp:Transcript_7584/g.25794  ORF Transcript_7584/g.25794 Transcript_7584/m.25794 type:complete len:358 (+) Transcript_7584:226-1299(+)
MATLKYTGHWLLQQRLVYSVLSGRPVRVSDIRVDDEDPGLRDFEVSLLRLLERMTNGSDVAINETGTAVRFRPGTIEGGALAHDCATSRGIGYYAAALLALAPFAKRPLEATLRGVTNNEEDVGVDVLRTVTLPLLRRFGVPDEAELKVVRRGAEPLGGGEVELRCPVVRQLSTVDVTDPGAVKRIRGVAYATRMAPHVANRLVDAARGIFNDFLPDVWIYTDHCKGDRSGLSPGYAIALLAESSTGCVASVEATGSAQSVPEDLGRYAAIALLREIERNGCVDSVHEPWALLLMALGPEDVSRLRFGPPGEHTIAVLRDLHAFFGVKMQLRGDPSNGTVMVACRGIGYKNVAKRAI